MTKEVISERFDPVEDGDPLRLRYTFTGYTVKEALATLDYPEGKQCQHSYDCCGHWYPRKPTVMSLTTVSGPLLIIEQLWYQNV